MQELFIKYLDNGCSPEEVKRLLAHFNIAEDENLLRKLITESLENDEAEEDASVWNPATVKVFNRIKQQLAVEKPKVVPLFRRTWFRIAAAVILLAGGFTAYRLVNNSDRGASVVKTEASQNKTGDHHNKAILTLSDGSAINLESEVNGTITQQGDIKITKQVDGELSYTALNEKPTGVLINSIATPRGGQYQVTLIDGTKIWLNAASSLRFPVAFNGTERKVQLSGEAYFEVAKNAAKPFRVEIEGKGTVEVLGTHFNVTAYPDETIVNTTLLEGQVKVTATASGESRIIAPGQLAQIPGNGLINIKNVDVDQAVDWKNGTFSFNNADLATVMRKLSRWYDVDIKFEGPLEKRQFNGDIQREFTLEQVVKLLKRNNVFCKLEGRTLTVLRSAAH